MEIPKSLAHTVIRSGQALKVVSQADLRDWALSKNLTPRQALIEALQADIFPECLECNFPCFSSLDQLRLFNSSVLVAGLGGLGGTLAELLARVGVGWLLLADGDVFVPSNFNRQWLARQATLGANKAEVAARHLRGINPALIAAAIPEDLTPDNLPIYLSQTQVVLDGLDNLKSRRELFGAARITAVPLVHGAVVGRFGQVTTILPDDPDGFTRIYPDAAREVERGREVLAPVASLIASLQVQEAIRLLLGQPPAYHGRLAHYDGDTGTLELLPLWRGTAGGQEFPG
jgi:molybdopterin/thiamine biosynthesis adenylyltransferase